MDRRYISRSSVVRDILHSNLSPDISLAFRDFFGFSIFALVLISLVFGVVL